MSSNEQAFRQGLSQFRWARGPNNDSGAATNVNANSNANGSGGGGFFARTYNSVSSATSGYIPLRGNERSNEEEAMFALGRWERCVIRNFYIFAPFRVWRWTCIDDGSWLCALFFSISWHICGWRLAGFAICLLGAAACFAIAFFIHLPMFAFRPHKFATSITLGSILVMVGWVHTVYFFTYHTRVSHMTREFPRATE
jgi:hypothetical protein